MTQVIEAPPDQLSKAAGIPEEALYQGVPVVIQEKTGTVREEGQWPLFADHGYIKGPAALEAYCKGSPDGNCCYAYGPVFVAVINPTEEDAGDGVITGHPIVFLGFQTALEVMQCLAGQYSADEVEKIARMMVSDLLSAGKDKIDPPVQDPEILEEAALPAEMI